MIFWIILSCILIIILMAGAIVFFKKSKFFSRIIIRLEKEKQEAQATTQKILDERANTSENRIIDLNLRIEEKEQELNKKKDELHEIENKLNDVQGQLWNIALAVKSLNESYQLSSEELHEAEKLNADLLTSRNSLEEALDALKPQIKELEGQLKELSERKRLALLNQEEYQEGLYEFSINPKEVELISILEKIKLDYPELKVDFATIEWRKIWLPKVQDLGNRIGLNSRGIYRLILKSDKNVCYVGQAVNIQDRWYQHIKKMIGVEAKGNEKLYNYRPEDFYWSVLEMNPKDINAAEHYWIEFYGCKEVGLNKKA